MICFNTEYNDEYNEIIHNLLKRELNAKHGFETDKAADKMDEMLPKCLYRYNPIIFKYNNI